MATDSGGAWEADVIVVGAGPAGLTAAAELARHGVRVRVIDRNPGPTLHSRASVVHVRTQETLSAMGLADRFVARAYPLEAISLHAFGKFMGGIRLSGADSAYPMPRIIGQHVTERLLLERLDELAVPVERGVEALGLADDGEHITLRLRRGGIESDLAAAYVIAADGADSPLRTAAEIPFDGDKTDAFEFLQTDCDVRWSYPTGRSYLFVTKDRFLGLFPFDADGAYRIVCARADQDPAVTQTPDLEEIEAILREIADPDATLLEPRWLSRTRTAPKLAKKFRSGRLFLVGDAAHVHLPIGGQGMNSGMQDGFNLGWKLAAVLRKRSPSALLHSYSAERQAIAKELIDFDREWAEVLSSAAKSPATADGKGFDPAATQSYFVRHGRYTAGTAAHYGPSILTGEATYQHLAAGLTIGMRLHSAPVIRLADAKPIHLGHTVKADGRWSIFAFAGAGDTAAPHSGIGRLCHFLADAPQSPVRKFTPAGEDIDSVIDVRAIFQQSHHDLAVETMPGFLLPAKGRFGLRDYEKIFTADRWSGDIFSTRGIDREGGCMVVVRPDQYVAHVLPLDGFEPLAAFFDGFMM